MEIVLINTFLLSTLLKNFSFLTSAESTQMQFFDIILNVPVTFPKYERLSSTHSVREGTIVWKAA